MKLPCKIIEDLLPLYEEGMCSEETREAVEQHLNECEKCKNLYRGMQEIPMAQFESPKAVQDKAMKKGLKKIKKYWWVSIIIAIMIVPLSILGWNQYKGVGISYTNWKEMHIANAFMEQLKQGDYEEAFEYIDLEYIKSIWRGSLGTKKLEKFDDRAPEVFVNSATDLQEAGGIRGYKFISITKDLAWDYYHVEYYVLVGKVRYKVELEVSNDGIQMFTESQHSFREDPLAYFSAWREWLWQDLAG